MSHELRETLDELRRQGETDSEGEFTLDASRARELLKRFTLENPRHYILNLVAAAVGAGATAVNVQTDADDAVVTWEGQAMTRQQLADLFAAPFQDGCPRYVEELAIGAGFALGLEPHWVRVDCWNDGEAFRLVANAEGEHVEELQRLPGETTGTRVHVKEPLLRKLLRGSGEEAEAVRRLCRYAPVAIELNRRSVNRSLPYEECLVVRAVRSESGPGLPAAESRARPAVYQQAVCSEPYSALIYYAPRQRDYGSFEGQRGALPLLGYHAEALEAAQAEPLYRKVLKGTLTQAQRFHYETELARACEELEKFEEARERFLNLAEGSYRAKDYDRTIEALESVLRLEEKGVDLEDSAGTLAWLAESLYRRGERERAATRIDQARKRFEEAGGEHLGQRLSELARICLDHGDHARAKILSDRAGTLTTDPSLAPCASCGSPRVMRNLRVEDRGNGDRRADLEVLLGNPSPDALVFDYGVRAPLRADVCGSCGSVVLKVPEPEALWKKYKKLKGEA